MQVQVREKCYEVEEPRAALMFRAMESNGEDRALMRELLEQCVPGFDAAEAPFSEAVELFREVVKVIQEEATKQSAPLSQAASS